MDVLRISLRRLRAVHSAIALACWARLIRSRALTQVFGFAFADFARELRAVEAGRLEFRRAHREEALRSSAMLRRNVHRLEKGLTMRDRQPIFALDYIAETVALFESKANSLEAGERRWARDVLTRYFATVHQHPLIDEQRRKFERQRAITATAGAVAGEPCQPDVPQTPYIAAERPPLSVDFPQLRQLAKRRRSIRWFTNTPVPHHLVESAVDLAREAPSACNRQPYFFKFIADASKAQQIASIAMGTTGYADQLPALVIVIGDWSCLAEERDRHIPYIDGALAAMQFMLACETLGLGTCPINWPDVEALERRMDRALNLPLHQRPVMLIAVGFPDPDGGVARSTKKPVGDLLR